MNKLILVLVIVTGPGFFAGCRSWKAEGVSVHRPSPLALPLREPPGGWNLSVSRGDTRETVITLCGRPDFAIGDDVWIYWNSRAADAGDGTATYNTLVVVFAKGQVDNMRLVNGDALRAHFAAMAVRGQPSK